MNEPEDFFDEIIGEEEAYDETDELGDEEDDDDEEPFEVRTAVMQKNDLLAILSLKISADGGGRIVRVDPRQSVPSAQTYEDAEAATHWFNRSLATSRRNGWSVVYDGEPSFG
ncbi:MAG TPA: hypothetical protein VK363_10315 [Pyrinomonadaceae bacterium]|nr:hypothetical protein [Pyrinomonadaceae bacterium]